MNKSVVGIENLSFQIREKQILKNVSLDINEGDIFGLVGNNGAGKTTLLKLILGLELKYHGNIRLFGSDNLLLQRHKIGTVMSILSSKSSIKGKNYLREICILCGVNPDKEIPRVAELTECKEYLDKKLNACSDGMYQRIIIAGALIGTPSLLILDEPFNAIDPFGMEQLRILLSTLNKKGITILVTSHILSELIRLATKFGVICSGSIKFSGTADDLAKKNLFRYIYKVNDLAKCTDILKRDFPDICGIPCHNDNIAVIAEKKPVLSEEFTFCRKENADVEEILRFYMNGKEIQS